MNALTAASPAEIDTELARIFGEIARYETRIERANRVIASKYASAEQIEAARADEESAVRAIAVLESEDGELEGEFTARGGWTRYWLVEGGHLHHDVSSYRCSRIATTSHYWMTELSGKLAAEVIELAGDRVCTVCFPDAPVAALGRPSALLTKTEAERAQDRATRQKAAAEKAAKAAEKGITTPEGQPLVIQESGRSFGETIKTQRAAEVKLVDLLWWANWKIEVGSENIDSTVAVRIQIAEALAHKNGTTADDELAAAQKRLAARLKREARL